MHNITVRYFEETKTVTEKAFEQIKHIPITEVSQVRCDVRNALTKIQGVDFQEDNSETIIRICDEVWQMLKPHLVIVLPVTEERKHYEWLLET